MRRSWTAGTVVALITLLAFLTVGSTAPAAPSPGRAQTFTYGSGSAARQYIVYTPRGYRPGTALPLLVMLHGCSVTDRQEMEATEYNRLADEKGFVVLYPEVDQQEMLPGENLFCWDYFDAPDWQRGGGDPAAVMAIMRSVMGRWQIDRQRIYLMGMSSGSYLTADMAAIYPDVFAAVGEASGAGYRDYDCGDDQTSNISVSRSALLAYEEEGQRPRVVPRFVIGGDTDNTVPPPCVDKSLQQSLRTNNLVLDHRQLRPLSLTPASVVHVPSAAAGKYPYTVTTYRDPSGCVIAQRYLILGMRHYWSGGSAAKSLVNLSDPKGPNASIISWRFFSRYTLSNALHTCAVRGP